MKKFLSVILVCSMILLGSISVFATDSGAVSENYDIAELFTNYDEKSLSEMVKFINENQQVYGYVEFFRNYIADTNAPYRSPMFTIYMTGSYNSPFDVFRAFESKVTDNCSKYLIVSLSRPTTPDASTPVGSYMLGEKGTKCFCLDISNEFLSYVKSLNRLDGNIMILDFLMNLLSGDVVGISFNENDVYMSSEDGNTLDGNNSIGSYEHSIIGDCNADGAVSSMDSYLMKKAVSGYENGIDPFAVDLNGDGRITAHDAFKLKRMLVLG